MKLTSLFCGLLALAVPVATVAEPLHNGNALKNSIILVIRHAEEPDDGDGLSSAGVEFIDENGGGPGVRLRKRTSKRSK